MKKYDKISTDFAEEDDKAQQLFYSIDRDDMGLLLEDFEVIHDDFKKFS